MDWWNLCESGRDNGPGDAQHCPSEIHLQALPTPPFSLPLGALSNKKRGKARETEEESPAVKGVG